MNAIFLGSIGSLVETSEIQRDSFNEAFIEHDIDWYWNLEEYRLMLKFSGGMNRIDSYAKKLNEKVDSEEILNTKSRIFQDKLAQSSIELRPGCSSLLTQARDAGFVVGLVTTTSAANVNSILHTATEFCVNLLDFTIDRSLVENPKPASECYQLALEISGCDKERCVAIEDNADGVSAAVGAGIATIAFPGRNTVDHDYSAADVTTDWLHFDLVEDLMG